MPRFGQIAPVPFLLAAASAAHAGLAERDAARAKAVEAEKQNLPKSAAEAWAPVYADALKDGAWAEAVEALIRHTRDSAEAGEAEDADAREIQKIAEAAEAAPGPVRPVLRTLLAHAYLNYLAAHDYELRNRTSLATSNSAPRTPAELKSLPPASLYALADDAFRAAFADEAALRATPLKDYARLLTPGNLAADRRPTLFDFLVHDAIAHFSAPRRLIGTPADALVLTADAPALGTVDEFLSWKPAGRGTDPLLRTVTLFQKRLRAHPRDSAAFADADLARLTWAAQAVEGDRAAERARVAFRVFTRTHAKTHPAIAAEAHALLAESLLADERPGEAHAVALAGEQAAPGTPGAHQCADLRRRIEQPELTLTGERVWNAPWPRLTVAYKNTARVRFRIVAADWKKFLERDRGRPEWLSESEKKQLLAAPAVREWTAELPPTKDFAERTERLPVPEDLAPGFHFLIATDGDDFSGKSAPVLYSDFWVSRLAMTAAPAEGAITGRIHDATTGEPVPGVSVEGWQLDRSGDRASCGTAVSDAAGAFRLPSAKNRGALLLAIAPDGHALASMSEYGSLPARAAVREHNRVSFFTDRAAYRPGHTIRFKGVVIRADVENQKFRPISERRVTVVLDDANGKEIERVQVTTNAFGSFEGAFTAPADRLPGMYALHTAGNENGRTHFRVEEYKKPTFEVTLDAPPADAALDGAVSLAGKAVAYTGVPADGAKVTWRVTRTPRAPRWCWWWNPEPPKEIASGETVADSRGRFALKFVAEAPAGRRLDGVTYDYAIHADVTDSAGETRSSTRSVALGRTGFVADLEAADAGAVTLSLKTPAGEPVAGHAAKLVVRRLKEPTYVHRAPLESERWRISYKRAAEAARAAEEDDDTPRDGVNLADPRRWEPGETVAELAATTGPDGLAKLAADTLPAGHYRVSLETTDSAGRSVRARTLLRRLPTSGKTFGLKVPFATTADRTEAKPGDTVTVSWGTGYETGRALVEVLRAGAAPEVFWTAPGETRRDITVPITEADRGSLAVRVSQVRENRFYHAEHRVAVPFDDKKLSVAWQKFTDKLTPGHPVEWTARVSGPDGAPVAAELAATLYDASLDPFMKLNWPADFSLWRDRRTWTPEPAFLNSAKAFQYGLGHYDEPKWSGQHPNPDRWLDYIEIPYRGPYGCGPGAASARMMTKAASLESAPASRAAASPVPPPASPVSNPGADLDSLKPRANLTETAFWFPRVTTGPDGLARFKFTAPEALTRWRCLVFAHDTALRAGLQESSAVTALDLMVKPNAPRFLREGDVSELPVRLINRTDKPITGTARLAFDDLDSAVSCDTALGNTTPDRPFTVAPHTSVTLGWKVQIPDGQKFLRYTVKAVSATGAGDGETGAIPVLPRRIQVTESAAGTVIGPGDTTLTLPVLRTLGTPGDTLRPRAVTVQTVARPAWYAVQALPYLMEYPHECSEQLFHRYYANTLAASVTAKNPALRDTFDRWRGTDALDSPLQKNTELKQLALEETPWVRDADNDAARRRRVALLFDTPAMQASGAAALAKLEERRAADGGWSWFPESRQSSEWVTRTLVLGFGRLRDLGAVHDAKPALPALPVLDAWLRREFEEIQKHDPAQWTELSAELIHHLHARSYFLKDAAPDDATLTAQKFFLAKCAEHWGKLDLASQARLALCLGAYGDTATPEAIIKSLRERAITEPARGMRWKTGYAAEFWRPWVAPVETQALLTEVFDTVAKDPAAADACRLALLDMKRTTDWGSTTATAEACHALLTRGDDWLAGTAPLTVTAVGEVQPQLTTSNLPLTTPAPEPGTGATEVRIPGPEVSPKLAAVKFVKAEAGPGWVSLHASYEEDAAKVKNAAGTGLVVSQQLFKKVLTLNGPELQPLPDNRAAVGDEVVVRVTLTADRDLDFVHLKTARPAALEPGAVVSGPKWGGALSWYEAVRDTATHRFIEHLPRGTHVFEFSARADRRGVHLGGVTEARCLYAPDFAAHTAAPTLTVD